MRKIYTPGVAAICKEINKHPELAYQYTAIPNQVAIVTNGTAILGLGDIGAVAGMPVMEGKAVLFKRFAGIDVFDIEVDVLERDENEKPENIFLRGTTQVDRTEFDMRTHQIMISQTVKLCLSVELTRWE